MINNLYSTFTAYPFKNNTSFKSTDPQLGKNLENVWRTARLGAVETYMDAPYYEQLQYVGDTRIQAMITYYNSGDDRLARQAITAINNSRIAEGATQSRYPSDVMQLISPFSLWWIGMVKDFYDYRDDQAFGKEQLPGIRQVLSFFEQYQKADGTLAYLPYWNFVDWPENTRT